MKLIRSDGDSIDLYPVSIDIERRLKTLWMNSVVNGLGALRIS